MAHQHIIGYSVPYQKVAKFPKSSPKTFLLQQQFRECVCLLLVFFVDSCCLQCCDAGGWVAGTASGEVHRADLHMAQLMPVPLTISCATKSRLVLPFFYWLTRVVLDKGPLNGCCCVLKSPIS